MTKLSFEEWVKMVREKSPVTDEEIETWKTKYYFGINTYDEYRRLLRYEYECYCKENETH